MHKLIAWIKSNKWFAVFFSIAFIITIFTFKDYGISTDEGAQRIIASENIRYIKGENSEFESFQNKDYGPVFEIPMLILEYSLFQNQYYKIYPFRHLIIHLLFLFSGLILYLLAQLIFKDNVLATLAFLFYLLHPRIYAHSFFNSKDIPFMAMLVFTYFSGFKFQLNNKIRWLIIFAVCSAILINMRIVGGIYVVLLVVFYLIYHTSSLGLKIKKLAIFSLLTCSVLYAIWPFLWTNPVGNLIEVVKTMSKFRWENDSNFLFGTYISAKQLPWYYLPVWIGITTPIIILLLFIVGLFDLLKNQFILFISIGLFAPVLIAIILQSVLYDDWRHFYFIYPLMTLIAVNGISLLSKKIDRKYLLLFTSVAFIPSLFFSIKNHPFQQVYFNELVSKKENHLLQTYERDYWGASFYQGLLMLKSRVKTDTILFHSNIKVGYMNTLMTNPKDKPYLKYVSTIDSADYFITNYRWDPEEYPYKNKLFDISVQNSPIISAWKIK